MGNTGSEENTSYAQNTQQDTLQQDPQVLYGDETGAAQYSEDDEYAEPDTLQNESEEYEEYGEYGEYEEASPMPKKKNFFLRHIKLFIFIIILIIAAVVVLFVVIPRIKAAKAAKNVVTQNFEDLEKRDIINSVAVTGTIKAKESRTVSTLVTNTKVVSVSVEVGDYVTAGQEICVFDRENLQTKIDNLEKQMGVAQAKSNETVTNAQVDVNKANTNLANDYVDNTTNVARMQQSLDDAMRDYYNACDGFNDAKKARDDAKKAFEAVEGSYNDAKSKYDALPDGVKAGSVSSDAATAAIMKDYNYWSQQYSSLKTAYDSAVTKVTQYETNIESAEIKVRQAQQNLDDAKVKTDRTLISDASNVATSELSQSTKNLEATTTNDNNRETMESYQTQLDGYTITAPISGIVTSLSVSVGDEFSNNSKTEVCVIQDDSGWLVEGTVDQYDVSKIEKGMKVVVKTDATGDDEMEGEVTFISPVPGSSSTSGTANQSTGSSTSTSYPIKIRLKERDDRIRIGMTAETSVILEEARDVYAVPYDCINENEDGTFYITVTDIKGGNDSGFPEGMPEGTPEGFEMPSGGKKPGKKPGSKAAMPSSGSLPTRKIAVKKGLETDYYTEIISDELSENLKVLVPEDTQSGSTPDDPFAMMGDPDGGPDGGGPGGGGPGGGGPGGGM